MLTSRGAGAVVRLFRDAVGVESLVRVDSDSNIKRFSLVIVPDIPATFTIEKTSVTKT